jgi:hypothetical protein
MLGTRLCAAAGLAVYVLLGAELRGEESPRSSGTDSKAAAIVRQALEDEVAGDGASRNRLLKEAASADPDYATARWQLGQVRHGENWVAVREAMTEAAHSELNLQYAAKRTEALGSASQELRLAQWCLKQEMLDRARLHFWRVDSPPGERQPGQSAAGSSISSWRAGGSSPCRT